MTNDNASRANNTDHLKKHLDEAHTASVTLHGLLEAINFLDNEGRCADGQTALIMVARDHAQSLMVSLDSVNLPEASA